MRWFADRCIPLEVVQRNRIGFVRQHYMPQLQAKVACIAFPYYRDGELINIKYRALAEKALVIAEHERKNDLSEKFGALQRLRKLEQGDAALSFYRRT